MRFTIGLAIASLALLSGGSARAAGTFECSMEQAGANLGWVPPVIGITHDEGAATAMVSDEVILNYVGQPIEASVSTDNAKRTTYAWQVATQDSGGQNGKLVYRLTIMKADLSARIKVIPQGYANDFDAGGRCKQL